MAIRTFTEKLTRFSAAASTADSTGLSYNFQGHAFGQTGIASDTVIERVSDHAGVTPDLKPGR